MSTHEASKEAFAPYLALVEAGSPEERHVAFTILESRWCWFCGERYVDCSCGEKEWANRTEIPAPMEGTPGTLGAQIAQFVEACDPDARDAFFYELERRWCWDCGEAYETCDCPVSAEGGEDVSAAYQAVADLPPLSVVRPRADAHEWKWRADNPRPEMPIQVGDHLLYLGLIASDSSHCAVATRAGRPVWVMHPEEFEPVPDGEILGVDRRAIQAWRERIPGVPSHFPPLSILLPKEAPDWEETHRRPVSLLYLGGGYEDPRQFAAASWSGEILLRRDAERFGAATSPEEM